jgi:hypothetical protein
MTRFTLKRYYFANAGSIVKCGIELDSEIPTHRPDRS